MSIVFSILIFLLVIIAIIDLQYKKIPNLACLIILVMGITANTVLNDGIGLYPSLICLLIGFAPMSLLYLITGLGAGDVKLIAAIGSVVGFPSILSIIYFSFLFSGSLALFLLVFKGSLGNVFKRYGLFFYGLLRGKIESVKPEKATINATQIPMAPGIALAASYVLVPQIQLSFSFLISSLSKVVAI